MQRKYLATGLLAAMQSALSHAQTNADVAPMLPPDAYREGFELDLNQVMVPAYPWTEDSKEWIPVSDFRKQ